MATRLTRTSTKAPKKVFIQALCPSCRGVRRCLSVGTGTVDGRRREIIRCTAKDCELEFLPVRDHLVDTPKAA
jgi:hypothetical protein